MNMLIRNYNILEKNKNNCSSLFNVSLILSATTGDNSKLSLPRALPHTHTQRGIDFRVFFTIEANYKDNA